MITEQPVEPTSDELVHGLELVKAKLESLRAEKRLYMKLHQFDKWGELDTEEQMLKRLLAEYEVLLGAPAESDNEHDI